MRGERLGEVNILRRERDKETHVFTKYFESMGLGLGTVWVKIRGD